MEKMKLLLLTRRILVLALCLTLGTAGWAQRRRPTNPRVTVIPDSVTRVITVTVEDVTFKMLPVEGGTFTMGATTYKVGGYDRVQDLRCSPAHQVTLSSFYICDVEVTKGLWWLTMPPSMKYDNYNTVLDGDYPMGCYDHAQAWLTRGASQMCCERMSKLTGLSLRLPTEAEWEFAARGGKKSKGYVYSGSNNFLDVCTDPSTVSSPDLLGVPVRHSRPNELGIYDMTGGVQENCSDNYSETYYASSPKLNPKGPANPTDDGWVVRGGYSTMAAGKTEYFTRAKYADEVQLMTRCRRSVNNSLVCHQGMRFAMDWVDDAAFTALLAAYKEKAASVPAGGTQPDGAGNAAASAAVASAAGGTSSSADFSVFNPVAVCHKYAMVGGFDAAVAQAVEEGFEKSSLSSKTSVNFFQKGHARNHFEIKRLGKKDVKLNKVSCNVHDVSMAQLDAEMKRLGYERGDVSTLQVSSGTVTTYKYADAAGHAAALAVYATSVDFISVSFQP